MIFLAVASFALVLVLIGLARTVREQLTFARVRAHGIRVSGAVVDNRAKRRQYYGGYTLTPVVHYTIGGRSYEASVANAGDRAEPGTAIDLLVDESDPWCPWSEYGRGPWSVVTVGLVTLFAAVLVGFAVSALR